MVDSILDDMNGEFSKAQDWLKREMSALRTGRASPALVENVTVAVSSYGASMPLNQLATITAPDARMLVVNPWDKGTLQDIERAIQSSGLGLNPSNDGQIIRVPIPALTGERRKEMVKSLGKMLEEAKVRARAVRRDNNELLKMMESDKEITEDELKRALDKVQKATDETIKQLDVLAAAKEKEVLEV